MQQLYKAYRANETLRWTCCPSTGGLNCLVAIELKVGRFEHEYLGKLARHVTAASRSTARILS